VATGVPYVLINRESAEVTKYASNAFLATKISFINMMSELCEATGADVIDVATAMGQDPRIGPAFLQAGIGYGGSCFPKDVKALVGTAEQYRLNFALVSATQEINDYQRHRFFRTILAALPARSTVAVWGLSFKPGTDDVREAASLECIPLLLEAGHRICAYDPVAAKNAAAQLPATVTFATSAIDSATQADAVILLTDWPEFRDTDLHQLKAVMAGTLLFDGRNAFDAPTARAAGFVYRGIGR
jgi:UDPglucose 6-dehydrogenase